MRVGLVLGAGGVAGGAWHAGVLAALAESTGWDARTSEVIVGTSAGSIAGTTLRAGLSPADMHATAIGAPLSADGARLMARVRTGDGFQRIGVSGRMPRPANPMLLRSLASFSPKPGVALAGLLPAGAIDASFIADRVEELCGGSAWPSRDLWIVAVRLADGRRIVFGRDVAAPLGAAVAASCAIPGFFMPIRVHGRRHVDGGAHSPTNADVLRGLDLDLVVVSAPMAGRWRAVRANPTGLARTSSRMSLDREVATVRRAGTPVLVLQPGPEEAALMDGRAMDPTARAPVAQRARQSALDYLATTQVPRPAP